MRYAILWTRTKSSSVYDVELCITTGTPSTSEVIVFKCVHFLGEFYGLLCLVTMTSLLCHQLEACYIVVAEVYIVIRRINLATVLRTFLM
jgi:hypothetical protein